MPNSLGASLINLVKNSPVFGKKTLQKIRPTPAIGLALGGGATWGIAHIGVLKALEDNNVPIHCISGTSIGAFIGGLYACGVSVEKLYELTKSTHWKHLSRISLPFGGLLSNEPMEIFFNNLIGDKSFSDTSIPFSAVATDLISGEEVLINSGKISTAIRASTAIPGIFHPIHMNDHTLVDGGVVNNVPVSITKEMGANFTIAVNLSPAFNHWIPHSSFETILKSFLIMQDKVARHETSHAEILINIDMDGFSPIDMSKAKDLLDIGLSTSLSHMDPIKKLLKKER